MGMAYSVLIAECLLMTSMASIFEVNDMMKASFGLLIILLNLFIVLIAIHKVSNGNKIICNILIIAFGLRVLLLLFDIYGRGIWILPGSGNDTEMFHKVALQFSNIEFKDNPYSYFVGIIYKLAFNQRIIAQYINLLFSMSTISIVIKIFKELNIKYNIKILMISILAFIPNYMILSVILLRESIMIFLLASSLLQFVKWWKYNNIFRFILSIVLVLIASIFHSGVIANAAGYIIVFILFSNKSRQMKLNLKSIVLTILFMVILMNFISGESNIFMSKFGNIEDVADITYRSEVAESGGSAYSVSGEVNSFGDLIKNSPIKIFYFITSPLPWNWRGINDIIAFLFSALFYLISYLYAIKSLRVQKKDIQSNFLKAILIVCILGAFIFAWGTSNAGTAMRHRDKFIVNYIVMLALSLNILKLKKENA